MTKARDHGHHLHIDLAFGAAWLRDALRQRSARRGPNVGNRIAPKRPVTDKGAVFLAIFENGVPLHDRWRRPTEFFAYCNRVHTGRL